VAAPTPNVVTVNWADDAPAAIVTVGGTVERLASEVDRATIAPPVGAAAASVTVPVELVPDTTEDGLNVTEATAGVEDVALPKRSHQTCPFTRMKLTP